MPQYLMEQFLQSGENFLGIKWYVVFKGKVPGVYPTWYAPCFLTIQNTSTHWHHPIPSRNFAATQVDGVSGAIHDSFLSKQEAIDAFDYAKSRGLVETI
jgi:hypothetical protein